MSLKPHTFVQFCTERGYAYEYNIDGKWLHCAYRRYDFNTWITFQLSKEAYHIISHHVTQDDITTINTIWKRYKQ